jgi:hypothetical protein
MLRPYPGDLTLHNLLTEITRLLSLPMNTPENWLDNSANFIALKAIYESDLAATANTIWRNVNAYAPALTSDINFRLLPSQIEALNTRGEVTINLVEMGFISPSLQNVKILDMGASAVGAAPTNPSAQLANVRLEFEYSGVSVVQSAGVEYVFQHHRSSLDDLNFWATDYDAIRHELHQSQISPSQIATIAALLGLDPAHLSADAAERLYAHPSAWADITIRKNVTVVPSSATLKLEEVSLFVRYDSQGAQPGTVALDVQPDNGLLPQILVSQADHSGRKDGRGSFTRYFDAGQGVTLIAQPMFGLFSFSHWEDAQSVQLGEAPQLTLALNQDMRIRAVYLVPAVSPTAAISGTVFQDINTNGVQDPGEPGIDGQTLFLDLDGSGQLKAGDPTAVTDANGNFQFISSPGTYTIRSVLLGGVLLGLPAKGNYQVTVTSGANVTGQNFAEVPTSIAVPLTLPPSTAFLKQGNANADYVEGLYRAILNRDADGAGLANWTSRLNGGTLSRLQVVQGIRKSLEHFTLEVTDCYDTFLGRAPDGEGLQGWVQNLQNGMPEEQMAFYFLDSPEYLSKGDKYFVDHMYESVLGRTFDTTGEGNWLNALGNDGSGNPTHPPSLTHETVIKGFLYSQESLTRLVDGYYQVYLQRIADTGGLSNWLTALQNGGSFLTIGQQFLASVEFYNRAAAEG